jgi:predicted RND superfamily exporter protein
MKKIRDTITGILVRGEQWLFANPKIVLGLILVVTAVFAGFLPKLRMYTDFNDLLPQSSSYIQTYNRIKQNFGGANQMVMVVHAKDGSIFNPRALALVYKATQGVDSLPYVDHNQVSSLTHRTVRSTHLSADGSIVSTPYYDPQSPPAGTTALQALQADVVENPQVYGLLISPDFSSALIRARLNEGQIDYRAFIDALVKLRADLATSGYDIHTTGNPVLIGYVYTYLDQIIAILFGTLALLAALLVLYFRRFYGVLLPLIGIGLSSIWGLGFMALCGFNLEPLAMPIPFLIAARATSHGVQLVARYYEEFEIVHDGRKAARNALDALFRPGSLAIIVDALGIGTLVLATVPFDHKLGLSAGFWALSVIFTVHFMVPLALTVLPAPRKTQNKNHAIRVALGTFMARTGGNQRGAWTILGLMLALFVVGGYYAAHVQIGDSEPGSPLLKRNHDYNLSTKAINTAFPGSEELHVLMRTDKANGLKQPQVLHAIETLQADMMLDPDAGGTKALPLVVRQVNRLTHYNDPRWAQIPHGAREAGGLMFAYMASSPVPGALKEFVNAAGDEADVVFYYKDHRAVTIDRAMDQARRSITAIVPGVKGLSMELAGGIIGVTAATNQAIDRDNLVIIPLVMLIALLLVMAYYRSLHAGVLMVVPMLFSTVLTYAYMGWNDIGIDVNAVPVIAVGVGVGIDYAVYFMDRIREEMGRIRDLRRAVIEAFSTTGYAVSFTAVTLVAGVALWIFMSDLRFQSDAALLLSFMLILNALAAMFIVPAWCLVFRPHFVLNASASDWEIHREADREECVKQETPGAGRIEESEIA